MKFAVKYALWLLPVLSLAMGCDHKPKPAPQQTLAPPIVDTPPDKPATVSTADLPPPVIGDTQQPPKKEPQKPAESTKRPVHHPKKPAPASSTTPETTTTASAGPAPTVSAVGQLSGGASNDLRSQTVETISSTEKGVNGITRTLNEAELKIAAQIHEFLKQAREALASGDVDGAHTLANKAKVLLAELNH